MSASRTIGGVREFEMETTTGTLKKLNDTNKTLYRLIPIKAAVLFVSVKSSELFFSLCVLLF